MLKKIVLVTAAFSMIASMAGAVAITGGYVDMTSTTLTQPSNGQGAIVFKPSNKVILLYGHDLAANAQNYTIASKHTSGNRTFSTSNLSTAIYYVEDSTYKDGKPLDSSASFLPANAGESQYASTWTGM